MHKNWKAFSEEKCNQIDSLLQNYFSPNAHNQVYCFSSPLMNGDERYYIFRLNFILIGNKSNIQGS